MTETVGIDRPENCRGGEIALAEALGVPGEALSRWLAGDDVPPMQIYRAALDLIAIGEQAKSTQSKG